MVPAWRVLIFMVKVGEIASPGWINAQPAQFQHDRMPKCVRATGSACLRWLSQQRQQLCTRDCARICPPRFRRALDRQVRIDMRRGRSGERTTLPRAAWLP